MSTKLQLLLGLVLCSALGLAVFAAIAGAVWGAGTLVDHLVQTNWAWEAWDRIGAGLFVWFVIGSATIVGGLIWGKLIDEEPK